MVYVAPVRPPAVKAASGGLDGGDGYPELTSGIPLCPCSAAQVVSISLLLLRVVLLNDDRRRLRILSVVYYILMGKKEEREELTVRAGSGVVEALQQGKAMINNVATGEDIRTTRSILASIIITTITTAIFLVRHFEVWSRGLVVVVRGGMGLGSGDAGLEAVDARRVSCWRWSSLQVGEQISGVRVFDAMRCGLGRLGMVSMSGSQVRRA